jgi:hypothetical protein
MWTRKSRNDEEMKDMIPDIMQEEKLAFGSE